MNDILSFQRNQDVPEAQQLASGKTISAERVKSLFPQVDTAGLQGGAVWFDASMPDSQRVLMQVLRWGAALGGRALNYVKATALLSENGKVTGIRALDTISGQPYTYRTSVVVNAAGPWSGAIAAKLDPLLAQNSPGTADSIFRPSLAWNVLFNRPALSDHALAVAPDQPNAQTYFLHPWKQRLLAGTIHNCWNHPPDVPPQPTAEQLETFIENLNQAIPTLALKRSEVVRVLAGILPVKQSGTANLASREVIVDHQQQGGTAGFYSVAGVKFTTSRLVAERALSQMFPNRQRLAESLCSCSIAREAAQQPSQGLGKFDYSWRPTPGDFAWMEALKEIVIAESVVHLDDLVLRRTSLGDNPKRGLACAQLLSQWLGEQLGWDEEQRQAELTQVTSLLMPT